MALPQETLVSLAHCPQVIAAVDHRFGFGGCHGLVEALLDFGIEVWPGIVDQPRAVFTREALPADVGSLSTAVKDASVIAIAAMINEILRTSIWKTLR